MSDVVRQACDIVTQINTYITKEGSKSPLPVCKKLEWQVFCFNFRCVLHFRN